MRRTWQVLSMTIFVTLLAAGCGQEGVLETDDIIETSSDALTVYDPGFKMASSNEWWVEVSATAASMKLEVKNVAVYAMTKTSYGTFNYGKTQIKTGTQIRFLATSSTGATAKSLFFAYLQGTPTLDTSGTPPPPTTGLSFSINSANGVHAISPFIYGGNMMNSISGKRFTFNRFGGNRTTAYNWENNASNAGTDWLNSNDAYLGGGNTPGEAVRSMTAATHNANAALLVSIPMIGYVSKDKNGPVNASSEPNYLTTRFNSEAAVKGSAFSSLPNTNDSVVYQDEFVYFLKTQFPNAITDARKTIFFALDNEPDLWTETHPLLQRTDLTYDSLVSRSIAYANAIKNVVPTTKVFGPVSYGWSGYETLQDAPDSAQKGNFLNYYLAKMKAAETTYGKRLVDVLDLHWYPEAMGGGTHISSQDTSSAVVAARLQAPRSLWDANYVETSWISQSGVGAIQLLPRIKGQIAANYPGTKLAFTEYYFGAGAHISGGIAQADVLGIFGRDDVFAANLWRLGGSSDTFVFGAFDMFNNYDGLGNGFGNTSVQAQTSDATQTSVYASVDASNPNRMVVIAINKSSTAKATQINISHSVAFTKMQTFQLTSSSTAPQAKADTAISGNSIAYNMPAMSVSTLVFIK
jgi:hypothetical protein